MTAALPSAYLSPTAGLLNALARHCIDRLTARTVELEADLAIANDLNQRLKETS